MTKPMKIFKALYDGNISLGDDYIIESAVLDDEKNTRVLNQAEISKLLGKSIGGSKRGEANMPRWISAANLNAFIPTDLREAILNPIVYKTVSGNVAHGIEATKLADVCGVWLNAEKAGKLHESQRETAIRAYILVMALAKTSIIRLVDEATGYLDAKDKAKDAIQQFLNKALKDEASKWIKTFQDEFFEMIFKMKGWNWSVSSKKPSVVGHYINDLVYSRIAPNILTELRAKNPKIDGVRKRKHHSHLTADFGHPILKDHLAGLIAIGRVSGYDWDNFIIMVNRAFPIYGQTIELNFPETLKEIENKNTKYSGSNRTLPLGLNNNTEENLPSLD